MQNIKIIAAIVAIFIGIPSWAAVTEVGDLNIIDDPGNPSDGLRYLDLSYSSGLTLAAALANAQATYPDARLATPAEWNDLYAAAGITYNNPSVTAASGFVFGQTGTHISSGARYDGGALAAQLGHTWPGFGVYMWTDPDGSFGGTPDIAYLQTPLACGGNGCAAISQVTQTPSTASHVSQTTAGWLLVSGGEVITFDSLEAATGSQVSVTTYEEAGFRISNLSLSNFGALNAWTQDSVHYAGSAALWVNYGNATAGLRAINGDTFSIQSVDMSERLLNNGGAAVVPFVGYLSGGGTVSTTFTTDGSFGFETFTFDSTWTDLTEVRFTNTQCGTGLRCAQFDNFVLTVAGQDSDGDGVNDDDDLCPLTAAGASVDANGCADYEVDMDGDGICDSSAPSSGPSGCIGSDNCPVDVNFGQEDADTDGVGDACDTDDDNDGVADGSDNCPLTLGGNADQTDTDLDGAGDICDADLDGDGVNNDGDVCPYDPDPDQTDTDGDLAGDACDANDDGDDYDDVVDNCPLDINNGQEDLDGDNIGDACDADLDGDGVNNNADNCPVTLGGDANQTDTDLDGEGDVCDTDDDNDSIPDGADNCPLAANTSQGDADGDGIGDACNDADDADGDEWSDVLDNCPNDANGDQADLDFDFIGDACDPDVDGDGVDNGADNCAATPLGELIDASGCTIAQLSPCDGPRGTTSSWKNQGKYVSSVAHAANNFRDAGLISDAEHGDIISAATQSACGVKVK